MPIVQGNSHVGNGFVPRDGANGVRLFDWNAWRVHVPAIDLGYVMATHRRPDRGQRMGRPLLDHYHNALLTFGVTGYTRRLLQDDYRRSVLTQMRPPVAGSGSRR